MNLLIIDENLMLNSKIKKLAENNGYKAKIIAFFKEKHLSDLDEIRLDFILINLESKANNPMETIIKLIEKGYKIIGYCGHTRTDLARQAKELGAVFVATNGMIVSQLPQIVKGLRE